MALIGNGMRGGGGPYAFRFGGAYGANRAAFHSAGQMRNFHANAAVQVADVAQSRPFGRPSGSRAPTSWSLGIVGGAIKSRASRIDVNASAVSSQGRSSAATATVTITGVAAGQLIAAGVANATIAFSASAAPAALRSGVANAAIAFTASVVPSATLNGVASAVVTVNASAQSQGYGSIVATTEESGLTPTGIAKAVWNSLASENDVAGSMGEKLNAAGAAGDPLLGIIEDGETLRETMRLLRAVLLGNGEGLEGSTMTFKSKDGTITRVTATYNAGTRTITLVDAS
jgi:hypothetical protein